jgi:hypothetical protein
MRISQKVEYAMRAMLELALHTGQERAVRTADIARRNINTFISTQQKYIIAIEAVFLAVFIIELLVSLVTVLLRTPQMIEHAMRLRLIVRIVGYFIALMSVISILASNPALGISVGAIAGVVIVSTPQAVSLEDATKAVSMFDKLKVPVFGLVENMSYFVCPHCGEKTYIFSSGGGRKIAAERGVEFLGEIPLALAVREGSDKGQPVMSAAPDSPESVVYKELAFRVAGMISIVAFAKTRK